jgi:hypothetical protein
MLEMTAGGRGQRGSHLGIGQPARDGGVAAIPQLRGSYVLADTMFRHRASG